MDLAGAVAADDSDFSLNNLNVSNSNRQSMSDVCLLVSLLVVVSVRILRCDTAAPPLKRSLTLGLTQIQMQANQQVK